MSRVLLGPGREFDLIRRILADAGGGEGTLVVGPGDDAAVLRDRARVVSTDLSVEGVHFRRTWLEPRDVGYRATMAALSDLAAMGARPVAVLVSLGGSQEDAEGGFLAQVGEGCLRATQEVGAVLAGGDVTRSPGPVLVDVVVLGDADTPVLRSGARPGDDLWVTGTLGGAAGAVRLWEAGGAPPAGLADRFARPAPRIRAMAALRDTGLLTAGLDLSDGLASDAGHLAAASGVEVRIQEGRVPVDPALEEVFPTDEARQLALCGGEDYELLVAAHPGLGEHRDHLEEVLGLTLTRIGRVREGHGVVILDAAGRDFTPTCGGYDHFGAGDEEAAS